MARVRIGYIYRIYNKENGKSYIGKTMQMPFERIKRHFRGKGSGSMSSDLKSMGKKAFGWEILAKGIPEDDLCDLETYYIKKFKALNPYGYNYSLGGEGRSTSTKHRMEVLN